MLTAALVAAFFLAPPAHAQMACGDRDKILAKLSKDYAERPVALGLTSDGAVIEVLSSATGSWTIIVTTPGGPTCVVSVGEAWDQVPRPLPQAVLTPASFDQPELTPELVVHLGCLSLDEMMRGLFNDFGETLEALGHSWDAAGRVTTLFLMTSGEGSYTIFGVRNGCVYTGTAGQDWQYLREAM